MILRGVGRVQGGGERVAYGMRNKGGMGRRWGVWGGEG